MTPYAPDRETPLCFTGEQGRERPHTNPNPLVGPHVDPHVDPVDPDDGALLNYSVAWHQLPSTPYSVQHSYLVDDEENTDIDDVSTTADNET